MDYAAANEKGLASVLEATLQPLIHECEVPMDSPPSDLSKLHLLVDCVKVPQTSGDKPNWIYHPDKQSLEFLGDHCATIQKLGVSRIDLLVGC